MNMSQHYLSEQHQQLLLSVVKQLSNAINDQIIFSRMQLEATSVVPLRTTTLSAASTTTTTVNDQISTQFEELYQTISILSDGIQTLHDDAQRLSTESICHQNLLNTYNEDLLKLKLSVEEKNAFCNSMKLNHEILQQDLESMKQKFKDLQNVSYDGTLTWKITNVQEKMVDAQSERQTSFFSPPFYSSHTGYKMRARVYFYGDGNARRTHMSLFFVLMRSEYDKILEFPFHFKVTFCLLDQTGQQRHMIDSFRPDVKSNSFARPQSDMNIASGIPKFVPLAIIQQDNNPYIHDDTMFIKVIVDFGNLPKTLLPYTLSLNPGLPTHVQQMIIRQEAEKREQQQQQQQQTSIAATNMP
ncbi:unnamed protein product [Rotaria sordida]|uniref:MATH domain-containing protein n=1 Tax=Rotaria sordida TaxID=392033 RepID=A0A819JR78_9BILA|nr:unnamed protein product [Rotaria sordida]